MKSGIYKILNSTTGKFYIGSAVYIKNRWATHKCLFRKNKHNNTYMQNAWNKYGEDDFIFSVLEYCDKKELLNKEQLWIDWLTPNYNLILTAGNCLGYKHSNLAKSKMKKPKSDTHKRAISLAREGMTFTKAHSDNISKGKKGMPINGSNSAKSRLGKKRGPYKTGKIFVIYSQKFQNQT